MVHSLQEELNFYFLLRSNRKLYFSLLSFTPLKNRFKEGLFYYQWSYSRLHVYLEIRKAELKTNILKEKIISVAHFVPRCVFLIAANLFITTKKLDQLSYVV